MKFGQQFKYYKIPEYNDNYLDYDLLKTILKNIIDQHREQNNMPSSNYVNYFSDSKVRRNSHHLSGKSNKMQNDMDMAQGLLGHNKANASCHQKSKNDIEETKYINVINEKADAQSEKSLISYKTRETNKNEKDQVYEFTAVVKGVDEIYSYSSFIKEYNKQVKNVDGFYKGQLKLNNARFEKILVDLDNKNKSSFIDPKNNKKTTVSEYKLKYDKKKEYSENDEMSYAASYKRVISDLYNSTSWLHSYCIINKIASQKISKKAQTLFEEIKCFEIIIDIEKSCTNLEFFGDLNAIAVLRKRIVEFYAREFTESNEINAKKELESRMRGNKTKESCCLGVYVGIISCMIFGLIVIDYFVNPKKYDDNSSNILPFFPGFNFTLCINLLFIGLSINIMVFKKYSINYLYIFDIDLKLRLGMNQILRISLFLFSSWLLILFLTKISLQFEFLHKHFYIFGLALQVFFIVFLIFPFHCFYLQFRKGIWITFIRNFLPFGKNGVRFRDFMFGDVLTSLTKPFASLIVSLCLITCQECRNNNEIGDCNRKTLTCLIIMLIPFVIRFFQCLNRFYYTKMAWPHLANAFKYCFGFSNMLFSWLYDNDKSKYFIWYIIIASLATSYMLFWDIYMDWGLARRNANNIFLRNNILYPPKYYYLAIFTNTCLRLSWLNIFITIKNDEMKNLVLSILEVYRRSQWSLFRVENENANNPEQYRAILEIPDYISYKNQKK